VRAGCPNGAEAGSRERLSSLHAFRRPRLWLAGWIALLVATVVVCVVPLPSAIHAPAQFDKLEHALGYVVLALYAANLFAQARARRAAWLGLLLFGAAIEGLQALTPWRSADPLDLLANLGGIALGAALGTAGAMSRLLLRLDHALR
jgi:VanZ family protein